VKIFSLSFLLQIASLNLFYMYFPYIFTDFLSYELTDKTSAVKEKKAEKEEEEEKEREKGKGKGKIKKMKK
jgi:hypothetical protein